MTAVICMRCRRDLTLRPHVYDCSLSRSGDYILSRDDAAAIAEKLDRG